MVLFNTFWDILDIFGAFWDILDIFGTFPAFWDIFEIFYQVNPAQFLAHHFSFSYKWNYQLSVMGSSHYLILDAVVRPLDLLNPDNLVLRWTRNHIQRELLKNWKEGTNFLQRGLISQNQNKYLFLLFNYIISYYF